MHDNAANNTSPLRAAATHAAGANSPASRPPAGGANDSDTMRSDSNEQNVHDAATIAPQSRDNVTPPSESPTRPLDGRSETPLQASGPAIRRFGEYELIAEIARGGMGVVFKARQVRLNRLVAIKMILAGQFASKQDVQRFYTEAEAAANLQHPHIVAIHEVGELAGQHYFSMDFVQGQSLSALVRDGPLPPRKAAEYVLIISEAIHYAHQHGILHRDLKPSNVLIDEFDQPRVTDFGLAKRLDGGSQLTASGTVIGTPSYMPPEQAAAKRGAMGPAGDVYSLGAILYELVTGRPPFQAATSLDTLLQVLETEPLAPRLLNRKIDRDVETICLKCLQKDARHRYPSARALADDLKRYVLGQPIQARPVGQVERLWRWCRNNPTVASLISFVAFLLVAAAALATITAGRERTLRAAADIATDVAKEKEKESRQRLARQFVASGVRLLDAKDLCGSLPWFVEAWELEEGDVLREGIYRDRIAAVLAQAPKPTQAWFHASAVHDARFSPDGRYVATAGEDGTAQVWNADTGEAVGQTIRHQERIASISFSPDGSRVVSASHDRTAQIWDARTGERLGPPLEHDGPVSHAVFAFDGRRVVTASWDKTARVWDSASGEPALPPLVHNYPVRFTAPSPDGRLLATASGEMRLGHFISGEGRIWDLASGASVGPPLPHDANVNFVCFSPDSTMVVTTGDDHAAKVWDPDTGKLALPVLRHIDVVNHAAFSPDGQSLVTACDDGSARVWDAKTGETLVPPLRHTGRLRRVSFSPDGRRLATASYAGAAHVWDIAKGQPIAAALHQTGPVTHVEFSADGHRLVATCLDGVAVLWDLAASELVPRRFSLGAEPRSVAFSRSGEMVAIASANGVGRVWDANTGQPITPPLLHQGRVLSVSFSPDDTKLLTASADQSARIWNVANGQMIASPMPHAGEVLRAVFSPDGSRIVTTSKDKTSRVWDAATTQSVLPPLEHRDIVTAVAWSPTRSLLVTGSQDKTVQWWNTETGDRIGESVLLSHEVQHLSFSDDGRRLLVCWGRALGEGGGGARVWDAETREPISPVFRHTHAVQHGSFDAAARRVVTASCDESARVWDAATGDPLTPPMKHTTIVNSAEFSPDGRRVLTASSDFTARLWDAATGEPVTPPLPHSFWCMSATFGPDGRRVLTRSVDDIVRLWELPYETRSIDQLRQLAELLAVRRVHGATDFVNLEHEEFHSGWHALMAGAEHKFMPADEQIASWHDREARDCLVAKQWFGRAWHLSRLIQRDPAQATLYTQRARSYAELGRWQLASADFDKLAELGVRDPQEPYRRALLRLAMDDLEGYRAVCARVLDELGPEPDPFAANFAVWIAALAADAVAHPERLVRLAEQAVATAPKQYELLNTLGVAHYRAGQYDAAVEHLTRAVAAHGEGGTATDWLFLAMACHRVGQSSESREWFDRAVTWIDREINEKTRGTLGSRIGWEERLELSRFRREAEMLIESGAP